MSANQEPKSFSFQKTVNMIAWFLLFLPLSLVEGKFFIDFYNFTNDPKMNNVTFSITTGSLDVKFFNYSLDIWSFNAYESEVCE